MNTVFLASFFYMKEKMVYEKKPILSLQAVLAFMFKYIMETHFPKNPIFSPKPVSLTSYRKTFLF